MNTPVISLDTLVYATKLPAFDAVAAHLIMAPSGRRLEPPTGVTPREAGVLALVYPENGELQLVLTRRTDALRGHSGQISFPGGRHDPTDASFTDTALRETCEELGVCDGIQVVGALSPFYIPPSNFTVHPTVGYLSEPPVFQPNAAEVAEVFMLPLSVLLDPQTKASEEREIQGRKMMIPYYLVNGHKVWGATAAMLSELEQRLLVALSQTS